MIVLDTNVVSEAMKPEPNPVVLSWLNEQPAEILYLSSVSIAEMFFGIGVLSEGRRKRLLSEMLDGIIGLFGGRILAFDTEAAKNYSGLAVKARARGRGFPLPDGYIAAIAAARDFAVATRDTGPFEAAGVSAINPWEYVKTR
jgi:predicted nucleic acid-binding protein